MRKNHCQLSCSKRMIKSMIVDDSLVSNSHDVINLDASPCQQSLGVICTVITQRIKDQT